TLTWSACARISRVRRQRPSLRLVSCFMPWAILSVRTVSRDARRSAMAAMRPLPCPCFYALPQNLYRQVLTFLPMGGTTRLPHSYDSSSRLSTLRGHSKPEIRKGNDGSAARSPSVNPSSPRLSSGTRPEEDSAAGTTDSIVSSVVTPFPGQRRCSKTTPLLLNFCSPIC